ncbi:uncharacterized protein PAC_15294 [Phialocephala subalpina]|uniref:Heterokaryon incompatibility domain-containing protein n=1 Tax=Phialocephala subalpina TaxID=576137 RepID=A0A1L7XK61_9HELO|nr:uncharacterized protein PAC_15294 [Phialocephala subalpina]
MPHEWADWELVKQDSRIGRDFVADAYSSGKPFFLKISNESRVEDAIVEIFTDLEEGDGHPIFPARDCLAADSGSEDCLNGLRNWLMQCTQGHEECRQSIGQDLPRRVIEVLSPNGTDTLTLADAEGRRGYYNALSHCWGQSQNIFPLATTKVNMSKHFSSLEWSDLSKIFQDAVQITRSLGIRYLWIGSLCIIQDDEEDWIAQAPQMSSIYTGAMLTISCSWLSGTLFVKKNGENRVCNVYSRLLPTVGDDPLDQRAWCLQERLLSSRRIEYTSPEMVWQCKKGCIRESIGIFDPTIVGGQARCAAAKNGTLIDRQQIWWEIVQTYTTTKLTKESDILPAISALALACGRGRYLARLWEEDLLPSLCWFSLGESLRPQSYTAPTFSWASQKCPVRWPLIEVEDLIEEESNEALVTVLDVEATTHPNYPLGAVSDGFLDLNGVLIPATSSILPRVAGSTREKTEITPQEHVTFYESHIDVVDDSRVFPRRFFCVPLLSVFSLGQCSGLFENSEHCCLVWMLEASFTAGTVYLSPAQWLTSQHYNISTCSSAGTHNAGSAVLANNVFGSSNAGGCLVQVGIDGSISAPRIVESCRISTGSNVLGTFDLTGRRRHLSPFDAPKDVIVPYGKDAKDIFGRINSSSRILWKKDTASSLNISHQVGTEVNELKTARR